jgi:ketosteroid isomerase-like protein
MAGLGIVLILVWWMPWEQATAPRQDAALPSVTLPADLARVLTDYEREWAARNAQGLAQLFAEDGFVLAGGRPPVRGRAAIEQHYTGSGGPLALRAFAYSVDGTTAYILGGYAAARDEADTGKFTLTLRKAPDGRWLIVSDMDNSNRRPAGGPAASGETAAGAPSELRQVMAAATEAWNRGDLDAYVAPYHEHATFMARRGPIGAADMRASFEKTYFTAGKPNQQLRYEQMNVIPLAADTALMTGRFVLSGGEKPDQSGWFTLVWVRTPAGWKIAHDHSS